MPEQQTPNAVCLIDFLRGPGESFTIYKVFKTRQAADDWGAEQLRKLGTHGARVFLCDLVNAIWE